MQKANDAVGPQGSEPKPPGVPANPLPLPALPKRWRRDSRPRKALLQTQPPARVSDGSGFVSPGRSKFQPDLTLSYDSSNEEWPLRVGVGASPSPSISETHRQGPSTLPRPRRVRRLDPRGRRRPGAPLRLEWATPVRTSKWTQGGCTLGPGSRVCTHELSDGSTRPPAFPIGAGSAATTSPASSVRAPNHESQTQTIHDEFSDGCWRQWRTAKATSSGTTRSPRTWTGLLLPGTGASSRLHPRSGARRSRAHREAPLAGHMFCPHLRLERPRNLGRWGSLQRANLR